MIFGFSELFSSQSDTQLHSLLQKMLYGSFYLPQIPALDLEVLTIIVF